jgi:thioredoxin-like negative regulator of GroEL
MQILTARKITRRTILIRWIITGVVVVGLVGTWLGYRPLLRRYHGWKQQRALTQAKEFIEQQDFPSARLSLNVALTAVPGDTQALRVAAELLEQVGSPEAMILRRRLVQLEPESLNDRVSLINSALRYRDINAARDALRDMPLSQTDEPAAIKVALAFALATENHPIADALYDRLKRIEPDNENLKVMHALLRLKSPRAETVVKARSELAQYEDIPRYALFINREMLLEAVQRNDRVEARRLAKLIASDPQATLADRLHEANFALNVDKRPFDEIFAGLTPRAAIRVTDAVDLIRWTVLVGQPAQGAAWLKTLPAEIRDDALMLSAKAELAAAQSQWDDLAGLLERGAWGQVDRDTVRLAFSAKLAGDRKNSTLQRQIWDEALTSAGRSLASLTLLYRVAGVWNWETEGENTLWAITKAYPLQAWAHQTLFNVYRQRRDTENMRALIGVLRERDGSMTRYRHDWALLSMLTMRSPTWSPPKQEMYNLYQSEPTNPNYITGYAFALAQTEKTEEAIEIIGKLPAEELAQPARAPYLAYIYGMARDQADFNRVAALESQLPALLPEERALFGMGREALGRPVSKRMESATEKAASEAAAKAAADGS